MFRTHLRFRENQDLRSEQIENRSNHHQSLYLWHIGGSMQSESTLRGNSDAVLLNVEKLNSRISFRSFENAFRKPAIENGNRTLDFP